MMRVASAQYWSRAVSKSARSPTCANRLPGPTWVERVLSSQLPVSLLSGGRRRCGPPARSPARFVSSPSRGEHQRRWVQAGQEFATDPRGQGPEQCTPRQFAEVAAATCFHDKAIEPRARSREELARSGLVADGYAEIPQCPPEVVLSGCLRDHREETNRFHEYRIVNSPPEVTFGSQCARRDDPLIRRSARQRSTTSLHASVFGKTPRWMWPMRVPRLSLVSQGAHEMRCQQGR